MILSWNVLKCVPKQETNLATWNGKCGLNGSDVLKFWVEGTIIYLQSHLNPVIQWYIKATKFQIMSLEPPSLRINCPKWGCQNAGVLDLEVLL